MYILFSNHKKTFFALAFVLCFGASISYADRVAPYSAGETLDPDCAPNSGVNCSVHITTGGGSQTLQQVLTAGSTLTQDITIDATGHSLTINTDNLNLNALNGNTIIQGGGGTEFDLLNNGSITLAAGAGDILFDNPGSNYFKLKYNGSNEFVSTNGTNITDSTYGNALFLANDGSASLTSTNGSDISLNADHDIILTAPNDAISIASPQVDVISSNGGQGLHMGLFGSTKITAINGEDLQLVNDNNNNFIHLSGNGATSITSQNSQDINITGDERVIITANDNLNNNYGIELHAGTAQAYFNKDADINFQTGDRSFFDMGGGGNIDFVNGNHSNEFTLDQDGGITAITTNGYPFNVTANNGDIYLQSTTHNNGLFIQNDGSSYITASFELGISNTTSNARIYMENNGNMQLFATNSANMDFDVRSGKFSFTAATGNNTPVVIGTNSGNTCTFSTTTGTFACASDVRLKHNINSLDSTALSKILSLNPVTFNYNWQSPTDASVPGFIAQEFETVFPDMVSIDPTTGYKSLSYTPLIPYTIKAIQDIHTQTTNLASLTGDTGNTLKGALIAWFADIHNGITKLFADEVDTNKLCVGAVCVTSDQFLQMVQQIQTQNTVQNNIPSSTPVVDPVVPSTTQTPPSIDTPTTPPTDAPIVTQ
ncbi:MAG: tail fiber domain-containing protein [bacterium]